MFPHSLKQTEWGVGRNLDGIWNLVLACRTCNGFDAKSDNIPAREYVERLHKRNEWLIASQDPLRDVLVSQAGPTIARRRSFLQRTFDDAVLTGKPMWQTEPLGLAIF